MTSGLVICTLDYKYQFGQFTLTRDPIILYRQDWKKRFTPPFFLFLSGLDEGLRGSEETEAEGVGDGGPEALRHHHSTREVSNDRDIEAQRSFPPSPLPT